MRDCWRSIRSRASSSHAFRSPRCRKPSSSAKRSRKPPRDWPRSGRHRARSWRCGRSGGTFQCPRQRWPRADGDIETFHQTDELFHATIADVAGYPGIWKFIQQVKVHVDRYRRLTLPQLGRIPKVISEHEAVLTAIEAHDPERARRAMETHLESLLDNISATQHINPEFFDERR